MIRTQVQLEDEQYKSLKEMASLQHVSISAMVRKAVDQLLLVRKPGRESLYREALQVAGKYKADYDDVAVEHDQYLAEAFK